VYGGQVTAIGPANSADGWTCGQTPVAANQGVTCSISGAALNAASPSALDVTVSMPANFADDPAHNKNCAMGGIEALELQSGISCATFADAHALKPPVVRPPVVAPQGPRCDARTTVRKGRACVCRFGGARKVSATRCACPRGTKLNPKRGRCEKIVVCKKPAFPAAGGGCACPRGWRPDGHNGCRKVVACKKPAFPTRNGKCACPRGYRPDGRNGCRKIVVCKRPAFPTRNGKCACPRGYRPDGRNGCRRIVVCKRPAFPTRNGKCACPKGYRLDGRNGCRRIITIRCIPPARPRANGRGCYCPKGWVNLSPFACVRAHPRPRPEGHPKPHKGRPRDGGGFIPKIPF